MALASTGAFLVLESAEHASARRARPVARLTRVLSDRSHRGAGEITATLETMWAELEPALAAGKSAILSGASGAEPATAEERSFLQAHATIPMRATGTRIGHGVEAQFPMNVALAALALQHGRLYPSADALERDSESGLQQVVVTGVGHWRGEGMALVEAVE
jgi:3-oxoacyl-[acyl-carrier-protein] synthase II